MVHPRILSTDSKVRLLLTLNVSIIEPGCERVKILIKSCLFTSEIHIFICCNNYCFIHEVRCGIVEN